MRHAPFPFRRLIKAPAQFQFYDLACRARQRFLGVAIWAKVHAFMRLEAAILTSINISEMCLCVAQMVAGFLWLRHPRGQHRFAISA